MSPGWICWITEATGMLDFRRLAGMLDYWGHPNVGFSSSSRIVGLLRPSGSLITVTIGILSSVLQGRFFEEHFLEFAPIF